MSLSVAILCNDRLALPAVSQLLTNRVVAAVGMPAGDTPVQAFLVQQCAAQAVSFQRFKKAGLEEALQNWLLSYRPDVVLVMTFPWLIPENLLSVPKYGFINFHYAPLPAWRGPNPLFWMIRRQVYNGGVTVHQMNGSFDNGPILLQETVPFNKEMTYGLVCSQLAFTGAVMALQLLPLLEEGQLKPVVQDDKIAGWYRRPRQEDLNIDWNTMQAEEIVALVKACNPWNKGAATSWNGWTFGITDAGLHERVLNEQIVPGTVIEADSVNGLLIAARDGKIIKVDVIYCEEGFYPGYKLFFFGLRKNDRLGRTGTMSTDVSTIETATL